MKIVSLKKQKHITANMSSGTGYSDPDWFVAKLDNGVLTDLWIDIWYRPRDAIKNCFDEAINEKFPSGSIENIDEVWNMYLDEIAEHSCPYTKEEILKATK